MVQIIDSPKSFGSSFSEGLKKSLPDALGGLIDRRRAAQQLEEENESFKSKGLDLSGIKNPKLRESLLQAHNLQKASEEKAKRAKEDLAIEDEIFNSKGINVKGIKDAALRKSIVEDWRSEQEEKRKRNYEIEDREAEDAYLKSIGIDAKGIKDPQMRKYLLEDFYKKKEETRKRNFEKEEREAEDKANSEYGVETSGIRNPQIRQKLFENTLKNENEESERNREDQYRESENKYFSSKGLDLSGVTNEDTRATLIDAFRKQQEDKTKRNQENEDLDKEAEQLEEEYGVKTKNIKTPGLRKAVLDYDEQQKKEEFEKVQDKKGAETIGKYFGPEAAEIYPELTEGGKTNFFQSLLDARTRNIPIPDFIGQYIQQNPQDLKANEEVPNERPNENGTNPKIKDPDSGLSPSERVARQEKRYDKNLPLYEEEHHKLRALQHQNETLEVLNDLNESKKLPSGFGRLNVDYKTGRLNIPALANPETQRFVKTINEFLANAKDTFGARISNFELDTFLQGLPTLANTEEGRREILKQMKYFNEIQSTYQTELTNVIEEAGGIRHIDWDHAQRLAEKKSLPKVQEAKNQFKNSSKISQELYSNKLKEVKKATPKGKVAVEKDGKFGYIDKEKLYKATKTGGYKRL